MGEIRQLYRIGSISPEDPSELNRVLKNIGDRLDELEGYRGQGRFLTVPTSDEQADASEEVLRFDQYDISNKLDKGGDGGLDFAASDITVSTITMIGPGIPHGSMYMYDGSVTVIMGVVSTWYRVPSGFTAGQENQTTFQNDRELVVNEAGRYLITWSVSFTTDTVGNQEIEGTVMVNNVFSPQAAAHRYISTATDSGAMSGTCILDLEEDDVVAIGILNDTGTTDVIVDNANLSMVKVGG